MTGCALARRIVLASALALATAWASERSALADAPAPGSPPTIAVRLREQVHAACPRAPTIQERLERQLANVWIVASEEPVFDLVFEVRADAGASVGRLVLTFGGSTLEREARSDSCDEVMTALAMMAAIALGEEGEAMASDRAPGADPTGGAGHATRPGARSPSRAPRTEVARAAPLEKGTRAGRRSPRSPGLSLSFGAGFEARHDGAGALAGTWIVEATAARLPLAPSLRVGLARSSRATIATRRGVVALRSTELTTALCSDLVPDPRMALGPCVHLDYGVLDAAVIDPPPARSYAHAWVTTGISARSSWQLERRLGIDVLAGVTTSLVRPVLYFEPDRSFVVYRPPPLMPFVTVTVRHTAF